MKRRRYSFALVNFSLATFLLLFAQSNFIETFAAGTVQAPTEISAHSDSQNDNATPAPNTTLQITIALSTSLQPAAAEYVNSLTDPSSPNYHHWLAPEHFAQLFGASQSEISSVVSYLSKLGLTNITVWPDGQFISAQTTRAKAESEFGVNIRGYNRSSADIARGLSPTFFAPDRSPSIDSAVASQISAIFGLSNAVQAHPAGSLIGASKPNASPSGYFDPIDLSNAYNTTPLHNSGLEGQGITIAIYSPTAFEQNDISRFLTTNNITSASVNIVNVAGQNGVSGNTDLSGQAEACIDIETALGQAPSAKINVYEAPNDGGLEIFQQVEKDDPNILSESWGIDEEDVSQAYATAFESIRQALAAEGISIFVASGDNGAFDSYDQTSVTVSVDASSAYVTAVGGTELSPLNNGVWDGEVAWTYKDGTLGGNTGSGGGISTYVAQPSWQTGVGVTTKYSDGMRQIPDVSALASKPYYDISTEGGWYGFGGTSCAAPLWAGAIALVEQSVGSRLGNIDPKLYSIAASNASPFHDITSGNDGFYYCSVGWDFVTGWGSADFTKLLSAFGGSTPTITSFTPTSGPVGTTVTVTGTNLSNATSITFGGVAATTISSDSTTQIVVNVPANAVTGPITVVDPQGSAASSSNYTVEAPFTLSSSPATLSIADGGTASSTIALLNGSVTPTSTTLTVSGLPTGVTASFAVAAISSATSSKLTFTASQSAVAGVYTVTVTGAATQGSATTTISLTITSVPVLTSISVTPTTASVVSGNTKQFTAVAKDQFGNTLATQPAITWTVTGGGTISATGLFTAKTVGGPFTVKAASGSISGSSSVTVTGAPSFTLAVNPTAVTVKQGGTGSSTLTLTAVNGFTGTVSVSITGLPTGVTVGFASSGVSAALTFTASLTAALGTHTVTITGTSGSITSSATVALTISANPVLTTIKVSPATATVLVGSTQQFSAVAYDQNGNSLSPQPTLAWSTNGGGTISSSIGLFTASIVGGPFTVTAADGSIKGTATVTVTSPGSFKLSAAPTSVSVNEGSTGKTVISLAASNGFASASTLAVAGLPTGLTAALTLSPITASQTSTVTFTASPTAAAGTYSITVTGTSGTLTSSVVVTVTIVKTSVLSSIALSPIGVVLPVKGTQQFTAKAYDQYGVLLATQPTFAWSVGANGGGSVSSAGLFTAGSTVGTFSVNASSGPASGSVVVKVELAPTISSLSLSSTSVTGGSVVTGLVTLNEASPTNGTVVTISTSNSKVAVPATTVTIAAGATTGSFSITTVKPASSSTVTISASTNSTTESASLKVN